MCKLLILIFHIYTQIAILLTFYYYSLYRSFKVNVFVNLQRLPVCSVQRQIRSPKSLSDTTRVNSKDTVSLVSHQIKRFISFNSLFTTNPLFSPNVPPQDLLASKPQLVIYSRIAYTISHSAVNCSRFPFAYASVFSPLRQPGRCLVLMRFNWPGRAVFRLPLIPDYRFILLIAIKLSARPFSIPK